MQQIQNYLTCWAVSSLFWHCNKGSALKFLRERKATALPPKAATALASRIPASRCVREK